MVFIPSMKIKNSILCPCKSHILYQIAKPGHTVDSQHSVWHSTQCLAHSRCSINVCLSESIYFVPRKFPMCLPSASPVPEDENESNLCLVSVWNANFLLASEYQLSRPPCGMWHIDSAKRHPTAWIKDNCILRVLFSRGSQKEVES